MLQSTSIWIAGRDEAPAVAALLGEFRDWWGNREPADADMLASVRRIMEAGDGEYLLGADGRGARTRRRVPGPLPLERLEDG